MVKAARPAARLASVDFLRGSVVMCMVFVNAVSNMKGVPAWTQHLPRDVDGYTITDMVLPWFLFLVGVSLPLSLGRFIDRRTGVDWAEALWRVFPRVLGLLVLGLIYVNVGSTSADATGMSRRAWMVLSLLSTCMVWGSFPLPKIKRWESIREKVKLAGVFLLVFLLVSWRGRGPEDSIVGIRPHWWGILGIIGWAYLTGALVYLLTRGNMAALAGTVGLMVCVYIASRAGRLPFPELLTRYWSPGNYIGSMSAIVVAGTIAGLLTQARGTGNTWRLLAYGLALWTAGWLLRPLHGYHKLGATESWALVAAGQGTFMLAIARQLLDRWKFQPLPSLSLPLVLIGQNALLAFIMPNLLSPILRTLGVNLMPLWGHGGAMGMLNAALYTAFLGGLTMLATRSRVILRL